MQVHVVEKKVKPKIIKFVYIILIVSLFIIGSFMFYCGLFKGETPFTVKLNYDINETVDYQVEYLETDLIDNPEEELTDTYINSFIKDIIAEFNYSYEMDKKGQVTYDYNIKGNLVYEYQASSDIQDTTVRNKEFIFVDTIKQTLDNIETIKIDKDINIDFPKINDEVVNFREETKLPVSAHMDVVMTVNVVAHYNDEVVRNTMTSSITIPFNTLAFSITKKNATPISEAIKEYHEIEDYNPNICFVGIGLVMLSTIVLILNFKFIFNIKKKSYYDICLNKILKANDDIIISLQTPIDETGLRVVEVATFNELLDLEDELRVPINFFEILPGHECEFTILHNDVIYKYLFINED